MNSILTKCQKKSVFKILSSDEMKTYGYHNGAGKITANIHFDDECGNGHNTFSITGSIKANRCRNDQMGGCIHDEIAKHFPKLQKYIKWHLVSTDGPMHYIANTIYFLSGKDCWGFRKGDAQETTVRAVDKDGNFFEDFKFRFIKANDPIVIKAIEDKIDVLKKHGFKVERIDTELATGKEINLAAARECAVWPDMPESFAYLPEEEQKKQLAERLPKLMEEFKADMEELGFIY